MTTEEILQRLTGVKRERPGQWIAKCVAHDDGKASLAVKASEDGKTLLNCLAGCKLDDILGVLGLKAADLFAERQADPAKPDIVATYRYEDERGELLYEVCRLVPKSFRQRRPDGHGGWVWKLEGVRRVLFHLPEIAADAKGRTVFVVEGEKDVETLRKLGFLATCCAGGANAWRHVAEHAPTVLKGRHVVVIPDNDEPGRKYAADVIASLRGAAKSIRMLELPGLAEHGDVSDWVLAGGTAEQLVALAKGAKDNRPELEGIDCDTFAARVMSERAERQALVARRVPYQVPFYDDYLGGILPTDLVLLTARSGAGKTHMASMVAESTAMAGQRVTALALEAERGEYERRIKYRTLAGLYRDSIASRGLDPGRHISYRQWYTGQLDDLFAAYEDRAAEYLAERIGERMHTVYRGRDFGIEELERVMGAMQDRTDLFIIDHFHFIDLADDKTETAASKEIIKRTRDLALRLQKPVVMAAQLRKADRFRPALIPSLDDIHGSSDVVKTCTQVLVLARARAECAVERVGDQVVPMGALPEHVSPTFMRILKDRLDGEPDEVALVNYSRSSGKYASKYALGRIEWIDGEEKWVRVENAPRWAKRLDHPGVVTRDDKEFR